MQNYNNELVKCIEDLKEKREEVTAAADLANLRSALASCATLRPQSFDLRALFSPRPQVNRQIVKDEEEKAKIQNDLRMLTERLSRVNDSVARKVASRNE